jgi:hypothetical protein
MSAALQGRAAVNHAAPPPGPDQAAAPRAMRVRRSSSGSASVGGHSQSRSRSRSLRQLLATWSRAWRSLVRRSWTSDKVRSPRATVAAASPTASPGGVAVAHPPLASVSCVPLAAAEPPSWCSSPASRSPGAAHGAHTEEPTAAAAAATTTATTTTESCDPSIPVSSSFVVICEGSAATGSAYMAKIQGDVGSMATIGATAWKRTSWGERIKAAWASGFTTTSAAQARACNHSKRGFDGNPVGFDHNSNSSSSSSGRGCLGPATHATTVHATMRATVSSHSWAGRPLASEPSTPRVATASIGGGPHSNASTVAPAATSAAAATAASVDVGGLPRGMASRSPSPLQSLQPASGQPEPPSNALPTAIPASCSSPLPGTGQRQDQQGACAASESDMGDLWSYPLAASPQGATHNLPPGGASNATIPNPPAPARTSRRPATHGAACAAPNTCAETYAAAREASNNPAAEAVTRAYVSRHAMREAAARAFSPRQSMDAERPTSVARAPASAGAVPSLNPWGWGSRPSLVSYSSLRPSGSSGRPLSPPAMPGPGAHSAAAAEAMMVEYVSAQDAARITAALLPAPHARANGRGTAALQQRVHPSASLPAPISVAGGFSCAVLGGAGGVAGGGMGSQPCGPHGAASAAAGGHGFVRDTAASAAGGGKDDVMAAMSRLAPSLTERPWSDTDANAAAPAVPGVGAPVVLLSARGGPDTGEGCCGQLRKCLAPATLSTDKHKWFACIDDRCLIKIHATNIASC